MLCPSCHQPLPGPAAACRRCGATPAATQRLAAPSSMQRGLCPRCHAAAIFADRDMAALLQRGGANELVIDRARLPSDAVLSHYRCHACGHTENYLLDEDGRGAMPQRWAKVRPSPTEHPRGPLGYALGQIGWTLGALLGGMLAGAPYVFWAACMALGLWMGCWGIWQIRLDQESRSWPTATGRIVSAAVVDSPGRGARNYWPDISYTYHMGGRSYTGGTIIFGQNGTAGLDYAEQKVRQYAPGTPVQVAYNPRSPQEACLEPGQLLIGPMWIAIGLGALFLACGVGGLLRQLRPPRGVV